MNRKHSLNADARLVKPFSDTIEFDAGQFNGVTARVFPPHWSVWRRFRPSRPRRTTALIGPTLRRSGRRCARGVAVRIRQDADLDGGGGVPRRRTSASRCAAVD